MIDEKKNLKRPAAHKGPLGKLQLIFIIILILMGMAVSGLMVFPYLLSLSIGAFLALLSYPLFQRLTTLTAKPKIAAASLTVGLILLVLIPVALFGVVAIQQGIVIAGAITQKDGFSLQSITAQVSGSQLILTVFGSSAAFEQQAHAWVQSGTKLASDMILKIAANVPHIILQLFIVSISCFFFLADGAKLLTWMRDKIPLDSDTRKKFAQSIQSSVTSVFLSTLAGAAVQSAIMLASFLALSVPAAVFAAGATFLLAWIPIIGSAPVWAIATVYLYLDGSVLRAGLMLAAGIISSLSDYFVRPAVLRGRENIHPLVILIAVSSGFSMFGIMGVFIGPIIATMMISLLQLWSSIVKRLSHLDDA